MFSHFHVQLSIATHQLFLHPFRCWIIVLWTHVLHVCFPRFAHMLVEHVYYSFTFGSIFKILNYNFNAGRLDLKIKQNMRLCKVKIKFYLFYHQGFEHCLFWLSHISNGFVGGPILCQFVGGCRSLFFSCYETHARLLGIAYNLIGDFAIYVANNSQRVTKVSIDKSVRKLVK
jgi:hypothetical protein